MMTQDQQSNHPRPGGHHGARAVIFPALVMLVGALMCTGCNVVAPLSYIITGPAQVPAIYTLPQKKLLVFVDDRQNLIPRSSLKREIAMAATDQLYKVARVVPEAVNPDIVQKILDSETAGQVMGITQVGEAAGADIVLYAEVTGFSVWQDGEPRPIASFNIRVIDVATRTCLWPPATQGNVYLFQAQMHYKEGTRYTKDDIDNLYKSLANFAGVRMAQLFYPHEKDPLDGQLEQ